MSSSRNKRKRADVEVPTAMVATPSARRRSRDGLPGAEPTDLEATAKNEGENKSNAAATSASATTGESSSASGTITTQPLHSQNPPTVPKSEIAAKPSVVTIPVKPPEEKKQETNVRNKPTPVQANDATIKRDPPRKADNAAPADGGSNATRAAPGGQPTALTARGSRIKSLLSHRKLLLDRVRSGRSAARGRIVDMARNEAQAAKQANLGESSRGTTTLPAKPAPLSEKAREEAEIAAFKKLSKSALQTAKKQRAENSEGGQEKRSSVTLRRGASVGQKMKAAVSSLKPENTGSAAVGATGTAPAQPVHVVPSPVVEKTTTHSTGAAQLTPLPVQRQASTAGVKLPTHQYAAQPTGKKLKNTQSQVLKGPPAAVEPIPKLPRSGGQKAIKTSTITAARATSSSSGAVVSGQPLHAGLSAPGLPINRLAQHPIPVVCHKAVALREKKKTIQSKLADLLQKRTGDQKKDSRAPDSFPMTMGAHSPSTENAKKKALSISATKQHLEPSTNLPRRRKTHWDTLLQEMKWMATDFHEERKWKISAARTLGVAVQSAGSGAVAKSKTKEETKMQSSGDSHTKGANGEVNETAAPSKSATATRMPDEAAPAASSSVARVRALIYHKPTTDDSAKARKVARIVSNMVFEVGSASLRAGALAPSNRVHLKALERHHKLRKELEPKDDDKTMMPAEGSAVGQDKSAASDGDKEASQRQIDKETKIEVSSFKRINTAVDRLLESFNASPRRPPKRKATSGGRGDGDHFALTSNELEIIDFVEKKWGQSKNGAGAILTGSKASGKTTAVCSLLWKQRTNGAQLVVCSPYRVAKWTHELNSFKPLRTRTVGMAAGISSPFSDPNAVATFGVNEVVVCEYSDLQRLKKDDFGQFETIVIDCRYPQGFLGSRWPSLFDGKVAEIQTTVPQDLMTESWWETLVEMVAKSSLNCVLIENPGRSAFLADIVDKTEMQRVELISLRAAFVLGARLFAAPNSSIKKRILTWARRRTKETTKATTNKVKEVQVFLLDLIRPFTFQANSESFLELVSHKAGKRLDLEMRPCKFSSAERTEYDQCCTALRGALSLKINNVGESDAMRAQNHRAITNALLTLRRRCFHSQLSSLITSTPVCSRLGTRSYSNGDCTDYRMLRRKVNDSSSQTDLELASKILEGSAKLRELVTILRNECDYSIEGEEAIEALIQQPEKPRRGKSAIDQKTSKTPKKVVILAVLPEVQVILSVLLNCIGLAHELLLRPSRFFCPSENDITIGLPEKQASASTLAWVECQQALSRFNSVQQPKSVEPLNLVIASPGMVAGDHGGIGIDLADFVISVDEDWSGRNELIMRSLVASLIPRNLRAKDKGCQLLKLVCGSTCEENFMSFRPEAAAIPVQSKDQAASWPWPLDTFGRFVTSDLLTNQSDLRWPEREHKVAMFAFPALNLFRFRNEALSDVLGVDTLPPLLAGGASILFLPQDPAQNVKLSSGQRAAEISLLEHMINTEDAAHSLFNEAGIVTCSPSPSHGHVVTRQDVQVLATRLYLEHFQKSELYDSWSDQGMPTILQAGNLSSPTNPISSLGVNSDTTETTQLIGGSSVGPLGVASSLLLYNPLTEAEPSNTARGKESNKGDPKAASLMSARKGALSSRANSYAGAFHFNHTIDAADGRQGSEPLVYFPPLFPRLLDCSIQAKRDIEAIRAKNPRRAAGRVNELKRPAGFAEDPAAPKRTKVENSMLPIGMTDPSLLPQAPQATAITEDETSHSDAATVLLDLDEDFGLAGIGAIPLPKDAVLESSMNCVEVSSYALDSDQSLLQNNLFEDLSPCDAEELDRSRIERSTGFWLNGVILFTARKKRQYTPLLGASPVYRPAHTTTDVGWPSAHGLHAAAAAVPTPGNGVFHEMNGAHNSAKKTKKKAVTPLAATAYARPLAEVAPTPHAMAQVPMNVQMAKAKEAFRNRIVAFLSARQKAMGMTLFESPAYCFAALRFRKLFNERVSRMSWAFLPSQKIGSGLPMLPEASFANYPEPETTMWTSIVKRLKTQESTTGDDARALAETQRSILRRSLSAPSRVDFGPFHCGFVSSLSGMTGISPPRSRSGVSLPMGVKVPMVREQQQQQQLQRTWFESEDRILRDCTERYGMNWILASRLLGGLDALNTLEPPSHRRSARNCRDRWQALARGDPSLAKEVQGSEKLLRESSNLRASAISEENDAAIRIGAPIDDNGAADTDKIDTEQSFLVQAKKDDENSKSQKHEAAGIEHTEPADIHKTEPEDIHLDDPLAMEIDLALEGVAPDTIAMDVEPFDSAETTEIKQPTKGFGLLLSAKRKKQSVPMAIPGVVPGSQPSFVASHPSHQQSVQSSIAATWTNGRTEMWPLQFLDVAEKQRGSSTAASADTQGSPILKAGTSSNARSPVARSPQSSTGAPSAARAATTSGAQRAPSGSGRGPAVTGSGRSVSSSGRPPAGSGAPRAQAVPNTGRGSAVSSSGRPPGGTSSSRAASAATGSPRATAGHVRTPAASGTARAQAGTRPHPGAPNNANHSRAQSQPYGSPHVKYPQHPHPQTGGHYAPPPHSHPGAHPGNPHHHHHHQHPQLMVQSSSSRTPRAGAPPQPQYTAHTVAHSHADSTKAKAAPTQPATSARASTGGSNRPPTKSANKTSQQAAPTQQQPKPKPP